MTRRVRTELTDVERQVHNHIGSDAMYDSDIRLPDPQSSS